MNRTTLRQARMEDVDLILELIRGLAEFEKLSHQVQVTREQLQSTLFGARPAAEVVLAFDGENVVGFAVFFANFSTFLGKPGLYLEDLYVQPAHRGQGFGKLLLAFLARKAVDMNCTRVEWSVLDWNQPAIDFYRSIGARPMDGWTVQRLDGERLAGFAKEFK